MTVPGTTPEVPPRPKDNKKHPRLVQSGASSHGLPRPSMLCIVGIVVLVAPTRWSSPGYPENKEAARARCKDEGVGVAGRSGLTSPPGLAGERGVDSNGICSRQFPEINNLQLLMGQTQERDAETARPV